MAFIHCHYKLATFIALIGLLNRVSSSCTQQEKEEYIRNNLAPACQDAMLSDLLEKDARLDGVDFDLVCTTGCMGSYTDWLLTECNDTNTANLANTACFKSTNLRTHQVSRCRYFFPDIANQLVFEDTNQCAASLSPDSPNCISTCSQHLNNLIDTLGCCFQAIYNNSDVIASLSEEGFLGQSQQSVLTLFRMSELLESCREGAVPAACSGDPFTGTDSENPQASTENTDTPAVTGNSAVATHSTAITAHLVLFTSLLHSICFVNF